jgi:hypothetical protein
MNSPIIKRPIQQQYKQPMQPSTLQKPNYNVKNPNIYPYQHSGNIQQNPQLRPIQPNLQNQNKPQLNVPLPKPSQFQGKSLTSNNNSKQNLNNKNLKKQDT